MRTALIGILLLWLTGCASLFGTPETVTVEKGDTLYSISKRYDMPLRDLIDANGLKPPYTLKVGQVLAAAGKHLSHRFPRRHPLQHLPPIQRQHRRPETDQRPFLPLHAGGGAESDAGGQRARLFRHRCQ